MEIPSSPPGSCGATAAHSSVMLGNISTQLEDVQPWTAARCQRLLGQLQCCLASLRKLASDARGLHLRQAKRPSTSSSTNDEPSRPRKRVRHTYRQRRQHPSVAATAPTTPPRVVRTLGAMKLGHSSPVRGQVDFATPVWRKIRNQLSDTPLPAAKLTLPVRHGGPPTIPSYMVSELRSLRSTAPEGHSRLYQRIFEWLSHLLTTTGPESHRQHRKSLLSMCLRQVPACVRDIEAWDRQVSKEKGEPQPDVFLELYRQLEAFGPSSGGWRPLRLVVRSHAISLLSEAISDGMLDPVFVGLLGRLCTHLGHAEEAARLASSIHGSFPGPATMHSKLNESKKLRPLSSIVDAVSCRAMTGHAFECLSTLLRQGHLSVDWLTTSGFRGLWSSGLEAITAPAPTPPVTTFMSMAMDRLASSRNIYGWEAGDGPAQTLLSITAGVVAAALDLRGERGCGRKAARKKQAWRRLVYVLDSAVAQGLRRGKHRGACGNGLFILLMARNLAAAGGGKKNKCSIKGLVWDVELKELVAQAGVDSHTQYRQAIFLTCAIARCRGRALGICSHGSVDELCSLLDEMALPQWFGKGLRADVAFSLAQKTRDLRDLAFAERIPSSRAASTAFSGWRWEEGISEWVLPSPATAKRAAAAVHERAPTESKGLGHDKKRGQKQPSCTLLSMAAGDGLNGNDSSRSAKQEKRPERSSGKSGAREKERRLRAAARGLVSSQPPALSATSDDWDELQMVIG